MSLTITAKNATCIGEGVWKFEMPPHQVRLFGTPAHSTGARSVILLKSCSFDAGSETLQFEIDDAVALNVGTKPDTIAVAAAVGPEERPASIAALAAIPQTYGPGDREFLRMTKKLLPEPMQRAATALLAAVRQRSPGDLKRGLSRNFSETPDNFWYVIVQPRVAQLSITVRGQVEHFEPMAKLPVKDDRGNTRFKITDEDDVQAALELIFHAKRRQ
ncbi:hypothetical protein [Mesorhizobium sp. 1B3]|uniref:hypothetical protein n=1 Tax=Mesorhizobium sp. 1B3 TaxID=3243599 RepID=UPI003D95E471